MNHDVGEWDGKQEIKDKNLGMNHSCCSNYCHSCRDGPIVPMPSDDLEADLLRRFQALKSTLTAPPVDSGPASFKQISDQQVKKAQEEDTELERVADGRPPAEDGRGGGGASAEMEFARRMARLRGVEMEVEEDGDQEVRV